MGLTTGLERVIDLAQHLDHSWLIFVETFLAASRGAV